MEEVGGGGKGRNEAREISRVGMGYLGGSFLELRAVTTRNRTLKTSEVQAGASAAARVSAAPHISLLNINFVTFWINVKLVCLRALKECNVCILYF